MTKKIWGGRFKKQTSLETENFTSSIDIDKELYSFDIQGSIAHVEMLYRKKIIASKEKNKITVHIINMDR